MKQTQFNCPVEATLSLIGGKYKPLILWHLVDRPLHYMELQRRIPSATPKMLSQQLHDLEGCGMIHREVIPEKPPKTVYSLTAFGESIIPVIDAMCQWGRTIWTDWMCSRHAAAHNFYRNSGILPVSLLTFFFGPQIATPKYCRVLSGTRPIFSVNSS